MGWGSCGGKEMYILLYKEVAYENVKVLRYPDHFSTSVYLWSYYEKILVVDNWVYYLGGFDLCFGHFDNSKHQINDHPPLVWPGKDYYNPRESEPNSWEDTMKDEVDQSKYPCMPWHDF